MIFLVAWLLSLISAVTSNDLVSHAYTSVSFTRSTGGFLAPLVGRGREDLRGGWIGDLKVIQVI